MALKIRKDDQIMVIAGKERGKTGKVLRVDPEKEKVYVEKLNLVKRHQKPSAKYKHGGIIEKEAPLHVSNVMLLCEKCKGPVRAGKKTEGDRRVRFCKKCGEVLDK
ncbi:MAG TPA: 50S ribosomal protein L24 [Deltaproteobacteria bacterium]|nr:MAG: 50S ribosomal protein L24 [Deltaproteobacteria bacterium GWA2_55_82]OIJ74704.1 MAG: 50S ribosomal protein L24 [Deltaproteobacteria bacterium GWC2_55_46]HBG45626.1 50S ribosomal protein L24 [Deltaproteobacteria bacterium]HCY12181.1 50S ribosomal protein L24 [Deltaproteobacteria bacterium]